MSEEEIKDVWMKAGNAEMVTLDIPQLIIDLKGKMKKNDRTLLFRDLREIFAAVLVMCFFGYKSITDSVVITKIASVLFVIWCMYVIYRLLDVRKYKKPVDLSQPFKSQLLEQKHYLEQQEHLLDSIFSWYIFPFAAIMTLFSFGKSYKSTFDWELLVSVGLVLAATYLLCWGIYVLNKKAARTAFRPIIENIDRVLLQIDEETLI